MRHAGETASKARLTTEKASIEEMKGRGPQEAPGENTREWCFLNSETRTEREHDEFRAPL